YVGWCPLDYWDRPFWFRTSFSIGGWGYDSSCWNFVPWNHCYDRNIIRIVIRRPPADVGRGVVIRRAIKLPPSALRANNAIGRDKVLNDARRIRAREVQRDRDQGVRTPTRPGEVRPDHLDVRAGDAKGRSFRENER